LIALGYLPHGDMQASRLLVASVVGDGMGYQGRRDEGWLTTQVQVRSFNGDASGQNSAKHAKRRSSPRSR